MRVKKRRKYDLGFKEQAVVLLERSDKTLPEVARSLGVHPDTLAYWYNQDVARRRAQPGASVEPRSWRDRREETREA